MFDTFIIYHDAYLTFIDESFACLGAKYDAFYLKREFIICVLDTKCHYRCQYIIGVVVNPFPFEWRLEGISELICLIGLAITMKQKSYLFLYAIFIGFEKVFPDLKPLKNQTTMMYLGIQHILNKVKFRVFSILICVTYWSNDERLKYISVYLIVNANPIAIISIQSPESQIIGL